MPIAVLFLELAKLLLPMIKQEMEAGQVSKETQQSVRSRYIEVRDNLDTLFSGPEWMIEPDPIPEQEVK